MGDISVMKAHPPRPLPASQGPGLSIYALVTPLTASSDTGLGERLCCPLVLMGWHTDSVPYLTTIPDSDT